MILELRTYQYRAGTIGEALQLFDEGLPHRRKFSTMAGLWLSTAGLLDQMVHIWPYDDLNHRMTVREAAMQTGQWPPKIAHSLVGAQSRIVIPAPFSPKLEPRTLGRCYEICIDQYLPGFLDVVQPAWAEHVEARIALSSLVACGRTEIGPLFQWIHIWAYEDVGHRERVRETLQQQAVWPPTAGDELLVSRESTLAVPAAFSPLR